MVIYSLKILPLAVTYFNGEMIMMLGRMLFTGQVFYRYHGKMHVIVRHHYEVLH